MRTLPVTYFSKYVLTSKRLFQSAAVRLMAVIIILFGISVIDATPAAAQVDKYDRHCAVFPENCGMSPHPKSQMDSLVDNMMGGVFKHLGGKLIECRLKGIPLNQCYYTPYGVGRRPKEVQRHGKPGKPRGPQVFVLPLAKATPPSPFKKLSRLYMSTMFQRRLKAGDPSVALVLGLHLWVGTELAGKDEKRGCDLFTAAYGKFRYLPNTKKQGSAAVAAYLMGSCYYYGYGRNVDFGEALRWYQASASFTTSKPSLAFFAIGLMHYRGQGIAANKEAAKSLWKRAVALCGVSGCKEAKLALGALSAEPKGKKPIQPQISRNRPDKQESTPGVIVPPTDIGDNGIFIVPKIEISDDGIFIVPDFDDSGNVTSWRNAKRLP